MFWNLINPEVNSFFIKFINGNAITEISFLYWVFIICGLLMSISIHEFFHSYSAYLLGDKIQKYSGRMNINPLNHFDFLGLALILFTFIGYGKPVQINPNNLKNPARDLMLVALAGPASNILIAICCGLIYKLFSSFMVFEGNFESIQNFFLGFSSTLIYSLFTIGIYNLFLAVFNMLPIHPLDGRKVFGYFSIKIDDFLSQYVDPNALIIMILIIISGAISFISMPFMYLYIILFS